MWLRDGRRVPVVIPEGCLLLQAGKQFEWLTGGYVQAGMHEVSTCSTWTLIATRFRLRLFALKIKGNKFEVSAESDCTFVA